MSNTPFKLRSGNSPLKDKDSKKRLKKGGSMKNFFGRVIKDPVILPEMLFESAKKIGTDIYKKVKAKKGPY